MTVDSNEVVRWTPQANQGNSHTAEVFVTDAQGATSSQSYTILLSATPVNNAPSIASTPVFKANATKPYSYQVVARDPDGNALTYTLDSASVTRGMSINATTGLLTWANPTIGNYQVAVSAVDAGGLAAAQRFDLTVRANNDPIFQSTAPDKATPGITYVYDVKAFDAGGDRLTYALDQTSLSKGMTIDALGRLRWTPTTRDITATPHQVVVTVRDDNSGSKTQNFNITVAADTTKPQVTLISNYNLVSVGEEVIFQARATDNVKVSSLRLEINGKDVVLDSNGMATITALGLTPITAKAIARDSAGNSGESALQTVNIINPNNKAPVVSLDLSGIKDGIITAPSDIKGSVTDPDNNLAYYTLEVAQANSEEFQEIYRKNTSTGITNNILGKFDPSLLQNDSYRLRLTAYDTSGGIGSTEGIVNVAGELKLGNFRLSFTDLSVPVTGIPINLTRTYDTLTAGTNDDFGYGWRMEFRDTDLRTSVAPPDEIQKELGVQNPFKDGTRVYITLPGGKREGFTFRAKQVQQLEGVPLGIFSKYMYVPEFVPDKGVTSKLSVKDSLITSSRDTNGYYGLAGKPYNPADYDFGGKYTITTQDGTVYEINGLTGDLETVTDTNGNKLTYTDAGVISSTGKQITFERDAQGRIKSVKDPMGYVVKYDYDAKGDLISVTDRENNTTTFKYEQLNRPHYLTQILDPLKRPQTKTEYDDNGRLKQILDVNNQAVEFTYNPNNSTQIVEDIYKVKTFYEYDSRGNILTEIQDYGGKNAIVTRTYDDNNNLKSETDADGVITSYDYNSQGNITLIKDKASNSTYMTYNQRGQLLTETDALGRTRTFTYDKYGNLREESSKQGLVTKYDYNSQGNMTRLEHPDGQVITYDYDKFGNMTQRVDAQGNVVKLEYFDSGNLKFQERLVTTQDGKTYKLITNYTYDGESRVKTITDERGNVTENIYNGLGQLEYFIDQFGNSTKYIYKPKGELEEIILPDSTPNNLDDNPRIKNGFDLGGRRTSSTSITGKTTYYKYDKWGRLEETLFPDLTPNTLDDNPRTKTEYTNAGRIKAIIDANGNRTEFKYDDLGRQERVKDARLHETVYGYNKIGQLTTVTDPLKRTTTTLYDEFGRLMGTLYADGTKTNIIYDQFGRKKSLTDQADKPTLFEYRDGRISAIVKKLDGRDIRTEYYYDKQGNLIRVVDAQKNETRYEYNQFGQKTDTIKPMGERSTTKYDKYGRVEVLTDFNKNTVSCIYNNITGQVISKLYGGNKTITYQYDPITRQLLSITDPWGITSYAYDERSRISAITNPNGTINYRYDAQSNIILRSTSSDTTKYKYDALNRIDWVKDGQDNLIADYEYNQVGNLITTTYGNGVIETRKYEDPLHRLTDIEQKKANGQVIADLPYIAC